MANITIGYPNRIDAATLSGGSWETTLPRSNIQDRRLSKLARTTAAGASLTIDLGSAKTVGILAIAAHNFSSAATIRLEGDDASGFSSLNYDSGTISAYPTGSSPQELLEWNIITFG